MTPHGDAANESTFHNDIINQLVAGGWLLGTSETVQP